MPDIEEKFDSTVHHEKRKAKIKAENKQNAADAKEAAEDKEIAGFKGLPQEGETREQLLDRIRKMRESPPKEPESAPPRSEGLQKAFEAEQKAGREAVAKATAELERNRALQQKAEEGEKNKG
jgi:hypothetical protein